MAMLCYYVPIESLSIIKILSMLCLLNYAIKIPFFSFELSVNNCLRNFRYFSLHPCGLLLPFFSVGLQAYFSSVRNKKCTGGRTGQWLKAGTLESD